jgi:glycosyltransferase involved in cell wall biosynthesis
MRVLINAASAKMGGALTYLKNVLRWVRERASGDYFLVYVPPSTQKQLERTEASNIEVRSYPFSDTGGSARLFFDQVIIPRQISREGIDILFSSTGFGTFVKPCPEVLLVRNPVYFSSAFRDKYKELGRSLLRTRLRCWYSLLSVQCANLTLFPTQAMGDMVGNHIPLSERSTDALHYGFDEERFFQEGSLDSDWAQRIRQCKKDGHLALLNVSTYAVHKNFETLIDALARLREGGHQVKLFTTTSREQTSDTEEYDALRRQAGAQGVADDWFEMGYVPYRHLPSIYEAADLYVFPSFTESFGHSLVEAMASGLPIVAANMPVNREVCGPAGEFFPPFDADRCAALIARLMQSEDDRQQIAQAASERAEHFSWKQYTEDLLNLLRRTANRS